MAGSKTGTPSIIKLARKICRLVARYGAADLEARTSVAFRAAIVALIAACAAFELADDWPAEVDNTPPAGPEDPA